MVISVYLEIRPAYRFIRRIVMERMTPLLSTAIRSAIHRYERYRGSSPVIEIPATPNRKAKNMMIMTARHIVSESYQGTMTLLNTGF